MLSYKVHSKGKGYRLQEELGNFNSYLFILTQTTQLIIFKYAYLSKQEDKDQILVVLLVIYKEYFQQLAKMPFRHILQQQLYLFKVRRAIIATYQAQQSLDRQIVEYQGLELQMLYMLQLIMSKYQQVYTLLYKELMFQVKDLILMQVQQLKDNLNIVEFRGLQLLYLYNAKLIKGANQALL